MQSSIWHNELPGIGYNDVTLNIAAKAVQVVATVRHTRSNTYTSCIALEH